MILIKTVRVFGFRGLENIEIELDPITILTGINNSGKSSFLKALQLALGHSQIINQDDFFINRDKQIERIIIDFLIIPIDENGNKQSKFDIDWELLFTENRISFDDDGNSFVAIRTEVIFNELSNSYVLKRSVLSKWTGFVDESGTNWYDTLPRKDTNFFFDEYPFFYIDAQRDILNDIKQKNSYLGKLISKIEYSQDDIEKIEKQIEKLNKKIVDSSEIYQNIISTLSQLKPVMDSKGKGVEITPLTKKVRDLNKGISMYYSESEDSFPMEYHGMGTRSWSSLLTLKSFITILERNASKNNRPFFPILAIEEPESHLHPNAQKVLFSQIRELKGQRIISTHSPYIPAIANINNIRNIYKNEDNQVCSGRLISSDLDSEDLRKIERFVLSSRGEIYFSKALVFFEGETEEQAIPLMASKFFKREPWELGINFVGVWGGRNYLPFIRFANSYNIPWFIFSDGEEGILKNLENDLEKVFHVRKQLSEYTNIVFLENGENFEKYLINNGYQNEVLTAISKIHNSDYLDYFIKKNNGQKLRGQDTGKTCEACKQHIYTERFRNYSGSKGKKDAIYDCIIESKTRFGPVIADVIVNSPRLLPKKVRDLFKLIELVV